MFNNLCFYNNWHNGDIFSAKFYTKDLIDKFTKINKNLKVYYAHNTSDNNVKDLNLINLRTNQINLPADLTTLQLSEDTLFINTWFGPFSKFWNPESNNEHPNWISINQMCNSIYENIEKNLNIQVGKHTDIIETIPTTDWSYFRTDLTENFCKDKTNIVLICNGYARSGQSKLGLIENIIETISDIYKNHTFVCTAKFSTGKENIFFTDDIYSEVSGGDINEIAHLSTKSKLIVGKNSGPYMFTHVKENILDKNKIFLSLSHLPDDSYAYKLEGIKCKYFHHSKEEPNRIAQIIFNLLYEPKTLIELE